MLGEVFFIFQETFQRLPVRRTAPAPHRTVQVMVHACRGLRAAKEGLHQTVLLKALREERDSLAERLGDCEAELKRIHHSYAEMINPDMAVG